MSAQISVAVRAGSSPVTMTRQPAAVRASSSPSSGSARTATLGTRAGYAMALTILRSAYQSDRSHSARSLTTIARQIVWGFS